MRTAVSSPQMPGRGVQGRISSSNNFHQYVLKEHLVSQKNLLHEVSKDGVLFHLAVLLCIYVTPFWFHLLRVAQAGSEEVRFCLLLAENVTRDSPHSIREQRRCGDQRAFVIFLHPPPPPCDKRRVCSGPARGASHVRGGDQGREGVLGVGLRKIPTQGPRVVPQDVGARGGRLQGRAKKALGFVIRMYAEAAFVQGYTRIPRGGALAVQMEGGGEGNFLPLVLFVSQVLFAFYPLWKTRRGSATVYCTVLVLREGGNGYRAACRVGQVA